MTGGEDGDGDILSLHASIDGIFKDSAGGDAQDTPQNIVIKLGLGDFMPIKDVTIDNVEYGYEIIIKPRYVKLNNILWYAPDLGERNLIELGRLGTDESQRRTPETKVL